MTLKKLASAAFFLLFSAGIAVASTIEIEHPYARASSPIAKSGGVFLQITNNGSEDDRLIAVKTDAARNPQIHTNIIVDGVAKMRELEDGIPVPAGETVVLQRGGLHVMLMGLTRPFLQDETITITLVFEKAGEITIEVPIDNERQGSMGMNMEMSPESMENMDMGENGESN